MLAVILGRAAVDTGHKVYYYYNNAAHVAARCRKAALQEWRGVAVSVLMGRWVDAPWFR